MGEGAGEARGRRVAPVLAASVAMVAMLAGGRLLAGGVPDPGDGDSDRTVGRGTVVGGVPDGTVPSVFGHTRASATKLLAGLGLDVAVEERISCEAEDRPLATSPGTGQSVEPGDTVTLHVAVPGPTLDCYMDLRDGWTFLDFALGRGDAPLLADAVTLIVDDGPPTTVSGTRLATGRWGDESALTELRSASSRVLRTDDSYAMPTLLQREGTPPGRLCGVRRPESVGSREALTLTIVLDGLDCPTRVALYRTRGRIDTVVTWTARPHASPGDPPPVPDVVGMDLSEARDAVTRAGYTARVEEHEDCEPEPGVVEQAPTQQDLEADAADDPDWIEIVTLVVEVPHATRDCAGLARAAADFIGFARGGPPPSWAPTVELFHGYADWVELTAEAADGREAWSSCSGVAPEDCAAHPLTLIAGADQLGVGADMPGYECLEDRGGLPPGLGSEGWIVLHPADAVSCSDQWVVQLWIDGQQRISAVNLMRAAD